jgi:hypothetical protein
MLALDGQDLSALAVALPSWPSCVNHCAVPAAGVLAPGEAVLCQVSLTAGVQPQLLEAVISCHARPADPALDDLADAGAHMSGSPRPGGSTTPRGSKGASRRRPQSPRPPSPLGMSSRGVGDTARQQDVAEEEEEVFAEHPARWGQGGWVMRVSRAGGLALRPQRHRHLPATPPPGRHCMGQASCMPCSSHAFSVASVDSRQVLAPMTCLP